MQYMPAKLFNGCPTFFQEFNDRLVDSDAGRQIAGTNGILLEQTDIGKHLVTNLQSAASKWRLASAVNGLSYSDGSDVSDPLSASYSAQARVSLSVVAFEAFARIFAASDWPTVQAAVFITPDPQLCFDTRELLEKNGLFAKLLRQSRAAQQRRLSDFLRSGEDNELYPVCVAIRNAFAHGAVGGRPSLINLAPRLQVFILGSIETYCTDLGRQSFTS